MSGTPINSSKNIGPIKKGSEVSDSITEIFAKLVHHGSAPTKTESVTSAPITTKKISKKELNEDHKVIDDSSLPHKPLITKPTKINDLAKKFGIDSDTQKITTQELDDGFVLVDKFAKVTTEDIDDGFVLVENKSSLLKELSKEVKVLGTQYLNKFEVNQLEILIKMVNVAKKEKPEEAKPKLGDLVENLQKSGINKDEANAIKSLLIRENLDTLAPGLNFLNDSKYDYQNDASIKEITTKEFEVFFQKQDLKGSLAGEIRNKLFERFADKFKGELGNPNEWNYKEKAITRINESSKNGQISKEEIKTCLGKSLINDLPRAFNSEFDLTPEFFNGKKDKGAKELANPELKTKLGDELVDNLLTIKNDKSFIDFLSTAGASKEGAGKGNDETRKGYSGFSDSISRMEHRCNIFKKMINTENPQNVFAVEQKELITKLQKTRKKIESERDLKNKLEEDLRTEILEKQKNKLKSAINKVNLQLSFHLFNELSLERKLNDLKDISILIIPKLMDEEINKVIEEISKSDSPKAKKKLGKKQKELEELNENKDQIISNIKQMSKLDKNEITAIVGYTSEFYNQINGGLRFDPLGLSNNEKNKDLLNWTKVLKSALNKLDSVEGEVYRAEGKSERLNTKVSGNMFADLASTSTASKMSGTIGAYERGTLSVCNIKSGKSIADLSHFGRGEKEVLIPPAIMMKITDRFEKKPEEDWLEVIKNLREEAKNDQEKIQVIAKLEKIVNEEQEFLEKGNKEKKAEERVKPSDLVIFHEELFTEIK